MAAPHVSALAGILRSVNPRLSKDAINSVIRSSGTHATMPSGIVGYGMPNARAAVDLALAQTPSSRLTPLFSFYSASRLDYFYSTVPQMAAAALYGTLAPRYSGSYQTGHTVPWARYDPEGAMGVSGYTGFPDHLAGTAPPKADAWIFTTPANPKNAAIPLVPLYRLSWKCGDPASSPPVICQSNFRHIDTVYTADISGVTAYQSWGYKLDGIEGYIYPKIMTPQPPGTQRLMRKYNPARDDHAIFPETRLAPMAAQGYTQDSGSDWLGYVYPNTNGTVPTIQ